MIVKVCGMRDPENLREVTKLGVDMVGFIFYEKSPRFIGSAVVESPLGIGRVGVFVNETFEKITFQAEKHSLTHIQLHGNESSSLCRRLGDCGYKIIKAISVAEASDIEGCSSFEGDVDFFLFDTKCQGHGGSGRRFDWQILNSYQGSRPFLLSGGIDQTMVSEIKKINHPKFAGLDLNSRFEVAPALKDINLLREFLEGIS